MFFMMLSLIISMRQIGLYYDVKISVVQVFCALHMWKLMLTKSSSVVAMYGQNPGEQLDGF